VNYKPNPALNPICAKSRAVGLAPRYVTMKDDKDTVNTLRYSYALEKLLAAVHTLATGKGDVRSRLLSAWQGPLWVLTPEHLPERLREDFLWIRKQLHKYSEDWPGQLADLQVKEEVDPTFKEKYAHLYPNPVEATLSRIKNSTGSRIATKIFSIYDSLESITRKR